MDIYELDLFTQLVSEHKEFDHLLRYAQTCPIVQRKYILAQFKRGVIPHARAEEKIIYPAIREVVMPTGRHQWLDEFYTEHSEIDSLINDLEEMNEQDANWPELVEKARNKLIQHIQEEESHLFNEAKHFLRQEQLDVLLSQYRSLKEIYVHPLPSQKDIEGQASSESMSGIPA